MTCPKDFNQKECERIDAQCVDAYFELSLDDVNPQFLTLGNSWKDTTVDLTPAIQAGETLTELFLTPSDTPTALQYNAEHGVIYCIPGEDLARIIPMTKLKDVDQTDTIADGDVYMYDGETSTFKPYDLKTFITTVTTALGDLTNAIQNMQTTLNSYGQRISNLETTTNTHTSQIADLTTRMTTAEGDITNLKNRVSAIETTLTPPAHAPNGIKVAWGNIDIFSDYTNSNLKTYGIYTHDPNVLQANDERFA